MGLHKAHVLMHLQIAMLMVLVVCNIIVTSIKLCTLSFLYFCYRIFLISIVTFLFKDVT